MQKADRLIFPAPFIDVLYESIQFDGHMSHAVVSVSKIGSCHASHWIVSKVLFDVTIRQLCFRRVHNASKYLLLVPC
jgi:hypothetical protein